jgi:cbb3-type cytochrome oxidase subunit 3
VLLAGGAAALDGIIVAAMVIPLLVLAVICWIFWKAAKREEAEREVTPPRG